MCARGASWVSVCGEEAAGRGQGHLISRIGRRTYEIVTPSEHLGPNGLGSAQGLLIIRYLWL